MPDQTPTPVAARWDRLTTRDEDGTAWVVSTTDPGQPIALRLDTEHAEALAGSLFDTPDGEEVATAEDRIRELEAERDDARARLAALEEWLAVRAHAQGSPIQVTTEDPDGSDVARFRATGQWKVTVPPADDFHAAATWPSRAARRLEDDAHPGERSRR